MLIAGAGNLGKHTLDMLIYDGYKKTIVFYDDNKALPDILYGEFPVLKTEEAVRRHFQQHGGDFIATVGNNRLREKMFLKIDGWGGQLMPLVSSKAYISALIRLEAPVIIQPGVVVAHNVTFGRSCTIHANTVIGHDVMMGNYVSVATLSTLIGPCEIGDYTFIGTQVVVQPGVRIGKNAYVGTGKTVTENIPDHGTLA
jgi:sugar O-acyltransferase (sialic acid O-acetyltransferase NeuD family)